MVRRDPDDIVTALSRNLKKQGSPTLRITFKRGGIWQPQFAKFHSRISKKTLKTKLREESTLDQTKQWPLLVRYRENIKDQQGGQVRVRYNCGLKEGRANSFIESLMGVFRVNFFKNKGENGVKEKATATKKDPLSKSSARRKVKTVRNQERRKKRLELKREKRALERKK